MRHLKLIGLAVLAAFATTALLAVAATGSASAAEPEWGHCVPAKKGFYSDSNCTTKDEKKGKPKGKFEWDAGATIACYEKKGGLYKNKECTEEDVKKGVPKGKYEKTGGAKFTAEGGAGVLRTSFDGCQITAEGGISGPGNRIPREDCYPEKGYVMSEITPTVECKSEHATGEATGSDEVTNVSVRFKGCAAEGLPATTPGFPAGEIQTKPLKGRLGYINKSKHEVGVLLEPAAAGGQFAEFEAIGELMEHVGVGNATEGAFYEETGPAQPTGHDGLISPITPVNQMTPKFTQNYRLEEINPYEPPQCKKVKCSAELSNTGEGVDFLNIPSHFEGGQLEELEVFQENISEEEWLRGKGTAWDSAAEEITNVDTVEGEAEIKG